MKNSNVKFFLNDDRVKEAKKHFDYVDVSDEGLIENLQFAYDFLNKDGYINFNYFFNYFQLFAQNLASIADEFSENEYTSEEEYYENVITTLIQEMHDATNEAGKPIFNKRALPTFIPIISLAAMYVFDDFYYPVLFISNYEDFQKTCRLLGIEEPEEMPLQKDIEKRCLLYVEICKKLEEFRVENELERADVCALFYKYAPIYFADQEEIVTAENMLPSPTRIWFAGANKNDHNTFLKEDTSVWQGNPQTQVGDIVVIFALAPYSHIHSVWRAVKDSTFNPFDYYCSRIKVAHRVEVPHITLNEIKNDDILKELPIVRKNMQGLNGVEINLATYKLLQEMFGQKDKKFDCSTLPQSDRAELNIDYDPNEDKEKGVEEKILIPILTRLGYSEEDGVDWTRQLVQRLGRKEKGIPDFVFFPKGDSHQRTAPFLIEVKKDFKNAKQLKKDFGQGVSYARTLHSPLMGICDMEQIRIYESDKNGLYYDEKNPKFCAYWGDIIAKDEVFADLKKIIGKESILKIKI